MSPEQMRRAADLFEEEAIELDDCNNRNDAWSLMMRQRAAERVALARLLREQADAMEWRPIETAPRDGTRVLVCDVEEIMAVCYWSTSIWVAKGGAWIYDECRSDTVELNPTHWQPLPPPQGREEPTKPRRPVETCPACGGTGWQD